MNPITGIRLKGAFPESHAKTLQGSNTGMNSFPSPSLITCILVTAYSLVFFHLSLLVLTARTKTFVQYSFSAFLFDYGLMCLVGGTGAIQDYPPSGFYIGTFAFILLLAPLGTAYITSFLGIAKSGKLYVAIMLALAGVFATGVCLGFSGLSWRKVLSLGYAFLFLILFSIGLIMYREVAPYRGLPKNLRNFFICLWGASLQLLLLCVFQFLEIRPMMHFLWILITLTVVVHFMLVVRTPGIYQEYKSQTDAIREGKSRLRGIDVGARLARLNNAMVVEKLYRNPDLQMEDLANRMQLTLPQLSELINRHLGRNFTTYINEFRVAEAQESLVASPDLSILEIAFDCGFASKSSFNAVFRKTTGLTPSEFRNSARSSVPPKK
jgi:AraC-like DNA-binding protein